MGSTLAPRKIEANRNNALRSTGPRTPIGKRVVRWNALRHGLLSKEVVISAGEGKESRAEFNSLHSRLREDLQPAGVLEEMLVEKIAVCYWRLRRVLRCEVGEIRKDLDTATWRELLKRQDALLHNKEFVEVSQCREALKRAPLGLEYLITVLEQVREEVQELGYLSARTRERLAEHFGREANSLAHWCYIFSRPGAEGEIDGPNYQADLAGLGSDEEDETEEEWDEPAELPSAEECKKLMLQMIDDHLHKLKTLKPTIEGYDRLHIEAEVASLALPEKDTIDKILRYETAIERQLYRAMNQLERLQRQRRGELVPPPLNLEVSNEN